MKNNNTKTKKITTLSDFKPIEFTLHMPFKRDSIMHKGLRSVYKIARKLRTAQRSRDSDWEVNPICNQYIPKGKYHEQKISIIIPLYYNDDVIFEQLRSLLLQRYGNYEILIVNDNPSKALDIPGSIGAAERKKIKILRHDKNLGRSAARNTGYKNAQGEVLVFVDAGIMLDDPYTLEKINKMYLLDVHKSAICQFQLYQNICLYGTDEYYSYYGTNYEKIIPYDNLDNPHYFLSNFFGCTKKQFSRYIFDEAYGTRWGVEDVDFAFGQMLKGKARIIGNNNIHATARIERFDIAKHIKNRLNCGINFRYFYKKWGIKTISDHGLLWDSPDFIWIMKQSKEDLVSLLRKRLAQLDSIENFKKKMYYIPKEYSDMHFKLMLNISNTSNLLGYVHLETAQDVEETFRMIYPDRRNKSRQI